MSRGHQMWLQRVHLNPTRSTFGITPISISLIGIYRNCSMEQVLAMYLIGIYLLSIHGGVTWMHDSGGALLPDPRAARAWYRQDFLGRKFACTPAQEVTIDSGFLRTPKARGKGRSRPALKAKFKSRYR